MAKELAGAVPTDLRTVGTFVQSLVSTCIRQKEVDRGEALAASFDLLVGLFYYEKIVADGWLQCPNGNEHFFFPYVNVCPRCVLENKFVHHKAGKGQSANIGQAAVRALILFMREWFGQTGSDLGICSGKEPVDLVVYDRANDVAFLAEVKSAPLFTLPLAVKGDMPTTPHSKHRSVTLPMLHGAKMGLLLPVAERDEWAARMYYFSSPFDSTDGTYFLRMLTELVENADFFSSYLTTWTRAFGAYADKEKADLIYWLTGGCGKPAPAPPDWPMKGGTPESVSDGKTSVGMDRTDDIKKGVYQLLKLRMVEAVADGMTVKVGIVSNAHAARHHYEYVQPIQDVMWLKTAQTDVATVDDLPAGTPLHNLYDGIITFTKSFTRDGWLQQIFDFNG